MLINTKDGGFILQPEFISWPKFSAEIHPPRPNGTDFEGSNLIFINIHTEDGRRYQTGKTAIAYEKNINNDADKATLRKMLEDAAAIVKSFDIVKEFQNQQTPSDWWRINAEISINNLGMSLPIKDITGS